MQLMLAKCKHFRQPCLWVPMCVLSARRGLAPDPFIAPWFRSPSHSCGEAAYRW